MINTTFLYIAIFLMMSFIAKEFLKNRHNINFDNINISKMLSQGVVTKLVKKRDLSLKTVYIINRKTGNKSLTMLDAGINKATVMATLRQITGLDYTNARKIVNSTPTIFMKNISEKEADLTKQALEFVGAKIEIK